MIKRFLNFMGFTANSIQSKNQNSQDKSTSYSKGVDLTQFETEILINALENSTFNGKILEDLFILLSKLRKHQKSLDNV